ncbi:unnamed protein product [Phyllotreta striolata]|uniref:Fatty acyl-CoA reductase n=1 Tax=Phyllotreta striolata TaxID=444603 RepID=A0A9N9TI82_PHYSR|nr:unnamed protein product [Phyllotreta striolata]
MEAAAELSEIQYFYKNKSVLVTGVTGFLGKLVLEKVLRKLPVKTVYVLVRSKDGQTAEERCSVIFDSLAFGPMKRIDQEFFKKVVLIEGDLGKPDLGLSQADRKLIQNEIEVVFHCAAATKLNESLLNATNVNVRGTKLLVELAKEMNALKAFVFVTSVYSNFPLYEIHEKYYDAKVTAEKLLKLTDGMRSEADASKLAEELLTDWPNAYTFTLNVAEDYLKKEGDKLPLCIIRPSLLLPSVEEPVTGFTDSMAGLSADTAHYALGVTRVNYYQSGTIDAVPVDYVVNLIIASGWYAGLQKMRLKRGDLQSTGTNIYHCISSQEKPITKDEWFGIVHTELRDVPSSKMIQLPMQINTACYYNYKFLTFILHTCMAFLCDTGLKLAGKQPSIVKMYDKIHEAQEMFSPYLFREWYLSNDNTQKLLKRMSFKDRDLFKFDIIELNWQSYFVNYVKGIRVYLLKDPMSTLTEGRERQRRKLNIQLVSAAVLAVIIYVISKFLLFRVFLR